MNGLIRGFGRFWRDEAGATTVEYVLMVGPTAGVVLAGWFWMILSLGQANGAENV